MSLFREISIITINDKIIVDRETVIKNQKTKLSKKSTMKIFQLFRKNLAALGIEPHQPLQKNHFIFMLLRRLLIFSLFVLWIIFSTGFLIYEAKKLGEYSDSAYVSISLICYVLMVATTTWKLEKLFKLFESFEDLIKKRKTF